MAQSRISNNKIVTPGAYDTTDVKPATLKLARSLRMGDVIEAFYEDTPNPVVEVVVQACDTDGNIWGVKTVTKEAWENPSRKNEVRSLNTDKVRVIGRMGFNVTPK